MIAKSGESAFDVIRLKVSVLDHELSRVGHGIDPQLLVVDLSHGSLVLLDQVLDSDEVTASVVGIDDRFLLSDPGLLILNISEELLNSQRIHQPHLPV